MTDERRPAAVEQRDSVLDGVRVLHFPEDRDTTSVALVFGVGHRDESLATLGTLHALEHLVMDTVRRTPIEINASVDASLTTFTAEGSPERVGAFLTGVCRALADPPVGRLAAEARVLVAEGDHDGGSPLGPARFGIADLGLIGGPGPGPGAVTEDRLRAAAHWFVAGNALLVVDGPWPPELRLPLRDADRPEHRRPATRRWDGPHAVVMDGPACGLSLILPSGESHLDLIAAALVEERLTEVLRHQRGLTYAVGRELEAVADHAWSLVVLAEPPAERAVEAVTVMIETIGSLLADGPTAEELDHVRATLLEGARGRSAGIQSVVDTAIGALLDSRVRAFDPGAVAELPLDRVTAYLREAGRDPLYVVDERALPELERLGVPTTEIPPGRPGPLPPGEVFTPPLIARVTSRDARRTRVALTASGLAQQIGDQVWSIDWADVVGVLREPDEVFVVLGADGSSITIGTPVYRSGRKLVAALRTNVAAELFWNDPDALGEEER